MTQYEIWADGDFLRARVWGRDVDEPPSHICKLILEESLRTKLNRILVELKQKVPLSGISQYLLVQRLPEFGFTPSHKIALVHHTPGLYEATRMVDLVAGNRSMNVRGFADVESATAWLA